MPLKRYIQGNLQWAARTMNMNSFIRIEGSFHLRGTGQMADRRCKKLKTSARNASSVRALTPSCVRALDTLIVHWCAFLLRAARVKPGV